MKSKLGEIRLSQTIMHAAPGSIVDLRSISVLPVSIDTSIKYLGENVDKLLINDKNLVNSLSSHFPKLKGFIQLIPEIKYNLNADSMELKNQKHFVRIFPEWVVCKKCRRIDKYWNLRLEVSDEEKTIYPDDVPYYCKHCYNPESNDNPTLFPARLVVACKNGHLDDFPWEMWAHLPHTECSKKGKSKKNSHLRITAKGKSSQLSDLEVKCDLCGMSNTLGLAFDYNSPLTKMSCSGRRPEFESYEKCDETKIPLLRSATNLYFNEIASSISIPIIIQKSGSTQILKDIFTILGKDISSETKEEDLNTILSVYNMRLRNEMMAEVTLDQLRTQISKLQKPKIKNIRVQEYFALTEELPVDKPEFVAKEYKFAKNSLTKKIFEKVVLVLKLREVVVLTGFSRISPSSDIYTKLVGDQNSDAFAKSCHVSKKRFNTEYLPGVEYWGEGIFFVLNSKLIDKWKSGLIEARISKLVRTNDQGTPPDPLFVLAHTLAHTLIKTLAEEAGYSVASLKERLYASLSFDKKTLKPGFLIYTASADSEGSLGGLIRIVQNGQLNAILEKILSDTYWCSSDPICIETEFKGDSIFRNHASCHSCLFLPETTCETRNEFLDRALLVGTTADRKWGLFEKI